MDGAGIPRVCSVCGRRGRGEGWLLRPRAHGERVELRCALCSGTKTARTENALLAFVLFLLGSVLVIGLLELPASLGAWSGAAAGVGLVALSTTLAAGVAPRVGVPVAARKQLGFGPSQVRVDRGGTVIGTRRYPLCTTARFSGEPSLLRAKAYGHVEDALAVAAMVVGAAVLPSPWLRAGLALVAIGGVAILVVPHRGVDTDTDSIFVGLEMVLLRRHRLARVVDPPPWPSDAASVAIRVAWQSKDPEGRVAVIEHLLDAAPDRDDIALHLAWALSDVGRFADAQATLSRLEQDATDDELRLLFAAHRLWIGQLGPDGCLDTADVASRAVQSDWIDVRTIGTLLQVALGAEPGSLAEIPGRSQRIQPARCSAERELELRARLLASSGHRKQAQQLWGQTAKGSDARRRAGRDKPGLEVVFMTACIAVAALGGRFVKDRFFPSASADAMGWVTLVMFLVVLLGSSALFRSWRARRAKRTDSAR